MFTQGLVLAQDSPSPSSSKKLPFEIDEKKRLGADDVKKKKEGWYVTGLAGPFSDPNFGSGIGGRVLLFNNKTKDDPFFEYTPYRHRIFFNPSMTNKNAHYHWLDWDAPFIFDSQWRVRTSLIYDRNPNNLFFGIGESSMNGLSSRFHNQRNLPMMDNQSFQDNQNNLNYARDPRSPNEIRFNSDPFLNSLIQAQGTAGSNFKITDRMYNRYTLEVPQVQFSGERSFFKGLVRFVFGARLSKNTVKTYDGQLYKQVDPLFGEGPDMAQKFMLPSIQGKTKVTEDSEAKKIVGLNGGYVNMLRIGLVYDTRDFEPDPGKGVFAEVTHERSDAAWGSNYNFNRTYGSFRSFYTIIPGANKLVFASRVSLVQTNGVAPFFEYRNMWSTEGGLSGLGGRTTLRGYYQDRFVAPVMGFANFELRWRAYEIPGFTFNIAPLFDIGRPWDKFSNIDMKDKYLYSYGMGLRIIWNQATVIYMEWARGRETKHNDNIAGAPLANTNFYLNFGHIF